MRGSPHECKRLIYMRIGPISSLPVLFHKKPLNLT